MKRFAPALLLILVSSVAAFSQMPVSDTPQSVTVKIRRAVLRAEPSASSQALVSVPRKTRLDVLSFEPNTKWYLVEYRSKRGWLRHQDVRANAPDINTTKSLPDIDADKFDRAYMEERGWKLFNGSEDEMRFYDPATMQRSGDIVKIWSALLHRDTYKQETSLVGIHCAKHEFGIFSSIGYTSDGKVIASYDYRKIAEPRPIAPGSVIATLEKIACSAPLETTYY